MQANRQSYWIALLAGLLLSGLVSGCEYATRAREIVRPLALSFAVTYTDGGSELSVRYSVPPPDPGKVYVMWAYNRGRTQVARLAAVPEGVDHTVEGSVNFRVDGVIITQETSADVTRMQGTGLIEQTLEDQSTNSTTGRTPTPGR